MTKERATLEAIRISAAYPRWRTALFRERLGGETYQAIVGYVPRRLGKTIAVYRGGKILASRKII